MTRSSPLPFEDHSPTSVRPRGFDDLDAELSAEARAADLRARCVGCGLPRGAHTDEALTACERVS